MAYFEWTDELSVNVGAIDTQHKKLVEMINSLNEAMLAKKGREMQKTTIDAMVDYAATHFKLEEGYMAKFKYPGYDAHKIEARCVHENRSGVEDAGGAERGSALPWRSWASSKTGFRITSWAQTRNTRFSSTSTACTKPATRTEFVPGDEASSQGTIRIPQGSDPVANAGVLKGVSSPLDPMAYADTVFKP